MSESKTIELIEKQVKHTNDKMNKRRNNEYESFIKDLYLKSLFYKGHQLTVTDAYCENEYRDVGMKISIDGCEFVQKYRHIWYIVLSFSLKDKVRLKYSQYLDMTYGYEYLDVETRYKLELAYKEFINETVYSDDNK